MSTADSRAASAFSRVRKTSVNGPDTSSFEGISRSTNRRSQRPASIAADVASGRPSPSAIETKIFEGLAEIPVGLARRDDAKPSARRFENGSVDRVRALEGGERDEPMFKETFFDLSRIVGPTDMNAARRRGPIRRRDELDAIGRNRNRAGTFDRVR